MCICRNKSDITLIHFEEYTGHCRAQGIAAGCKDRFIDRFYQFDRRQGEGIGIFGVRLFRIFIRFFATDFIFTRVAGNLYGIILRIDIESDWLIRQVFQVFQQDFGGNTYLTVIVFSPQFGLYIQFGFDHCLQVAAGNGQGIVFQFKQEVFQDRHNSIRTDDAAY
ncbi:hypothetical protein D3C86_1449930 [compost metagenome]